MDELYENLLEAISALVESNGPWADKQSGLMEYATANGYQGDIEEFLGWWDVDLGEGSSEPSPKA